VTRGASCPPHTSTRAKARRTRHARAAPAQRRCYAVLDTECSARSERALLDQPLALSVGALEAVLAAPAAAPAAPALDPAAGDPWEGALLGLMSSGLVLQTVPAGLAVCLSLFPGAACLSAKRENGRFRGGAGAAGCGACGAPPRSLRLVKSCGRGLARACGRCTCLPSLRSGRWGADRESCLQALARLFVRPQGEQALECAPSVLV